MNFKSRVLLIISALISSFNVAQAQSTEYLVNWHNYRSLVGGWPSGTLIYNVSAKGTSTDSVIVGVNVSGNTEILVESGGSSSFLIPASPTVSSLVYQSKGCLIIHTEASEMTGGQNVNITFTFAKPVQDLKFTLYDIDGNDAAEPGVDREERVIVTADHSGTSVTPTLMTGSAKNTVTGNTAVGNSPANNSSTEGDVHVDFTGKEVTSVTINFSIINIVGTPSANAEPGFGIGDLEFQALQTVSLQYLDFTVNHHKSGNEIIVKSPNEFDEIQTVIIEKSFNSNKEWQSIKTFEITDNSLVNELTYLDQAIHEGYVLYRIKYISNGETHYTITKSVYSKQEQAIIAFPNPFTKQLTLNGVKEGHILLILDMYGRVLIEKHVTQQTESINTNHWPSGNYIYTILDAQKNVVVNGMITKQQ